MDTVAEISDCDEKVAEAVGRIAQAKRKKRGLDDIIDRLTQSKQNQETQAPCYQMKANTSGPKDKRKRA
ncbi:hypothetical protein ABEB36_010444 [Hypothenemus hampei]|uniref:Uncharacterized protein n=1 Tax=Hypothenemus hampei TaxID=57062 RepID=A0ABD1EJQ5_HYPHA